MSYVDLSTHPAEMARVFASLGLSRPGEAVSAVALTGGVSSGIYRVDLDSGSYCLKQALPQLKVAKLWLAPVERVFHEVQWLRVAHGIVPGHVPRVLGVDEPSKSFVMPFLGADHLNWKSLLLGAQVNPLVGRRVGDLLGRIHAATADRVDLAESFATDANFHAIRLEPYLVESARVHPTLADTLLATVERTAATRRVLVHGDVSPKNILLRGHAPAPHDHPVLLDAECAWYGDPAFDLAFCLNHMLLKAAHLPMAAPALMQCFMELKAACLAHTHWEAATDLDHRCAQLLPGLTLARVDGKSPVEYLTEPARDRVRDAAIGLLRQAPPNLDELARRWAAIFIT